VPKDADWLKQSGAVAQIWSSGLLLLSTPNSVFLGNKASTEVNDADQRLWGVRLDNARQRLQDSDIRLAEDLVYSSKAYIEYRRRWDPLVRLVGDAMAYDPGEIDTALQGPKYGRRNSVQTEL
jgi:hypothetical protein